MVVGIDLLVTWIVIVALIVNEEVSVEVTGASEEISLVVTLPLVVVLLLVIVTVPLVENLPLHAGRKEMADEGEAIVDPLYAVHPGEAATGTEVAVQRVIGEETVIAMIEMTEMI